MKANISRLVPGILILAVLLGGLSAGLARLGWSGWLVRPALAAVHGPLMVSGFLGTLITLERAVAQQRPFFYLLPVAAGVGAVALLLQTPGPWGALLITLASLGLVVYFSQIAWQHRALYTLLLALGAANWAVGNLLWLAGRPLAEVTFWWLGFLLLTIVGERLELSRVRKLSSRSQQLLAVAAGLLLLALVILLLNFELGARLVGLAVLVLAGWLTRYDVARRTIHQTGLPRFIAVALLSGYGWLALTGVLALALGGVMAGPYYDAILHAFFLGFVFAMVFGHAPIILPAILKRPIAYRATFYLPLILLQISLLLRLVGDLVGWFELRRWGGLLNVLVLLLFMANMIYTVKKTPK